MIVTPRFQNVFVYLQSNYHYQHYLACSVKTETPVSSKRDNELFGGTINYRFGDLYLILTVFPGVILLIDGDNLPIQST